MKPWTGESLAVVAMEPDDGAVPPEAHAIGATYFIEIDIADEFLHGWNSTEGSSAPERARCDRLIYYATYDC
ncbi:MAG: hypothetical protein Q8S73_00925 [Deltaproteobacteria bacterium]|nr:hypothetical protein [Myxococcales bacterium]MDP3212637.1 hypothetical protein [Deltaproteobacteria bacterium]